MTLRAAIGRMDDLYNLLLRRLVFLLLFVMFATTLVATIFRYAPFLPGLTWAEEVTRYTSIWMVFLASAMGIRRGVHLGVDVFVILLPTGVRRLVTLFALSLVFVFEWVLVYFGVIMTVNNAEQMSSALEMPMALPFLAIPIGGLFMAYETGRELLSHVRPPSVP